jgi:hypothetical protein
MITVIIVSVIIILIWFYIIPKIKSNNNSEVNVDSVKVDVVWSAKLKSVTEKFKSTDSIFFTDVLDKDVSEDKYTNIWWKENMTFNNTKELKVFYPKWSYSPSSDPRWWAGFIYKMWKKLDKAKLSYKVKFDDNFDFVKWWKLPWFCSWECPRWWADSWSDFSTRFMWRAKWDIELYAYLPTNTSTYWKSFWKGTFRFQPWKYYKIEQTIKLNTPWKDDWEMIIYVDNSEVFRDNKVVFREKDDVHIDSIIFSTFFWWSDASWATPNDTYSFYKDFTLSY